MKKGEMMGEIFGIAFVFVVFAVMVNTGMVCANDESPPSIKSSSEVITVVNEQYIPNSVQAMKNRGESESASEWEGTKAGEPILQYWLNEGKNEIEPHWWIVPIEKDGNAVGAIGVDPYSLELAWRISGINNDHGIHQPTAFALEPLVKVNGLENDYDISEVKLVLIRNDHYWLIPSKTAEDFTDWILIDYGIVDSLPIFSFPFSQALNSVKKVREVIAEPFVELKPETVRETERAQIEKPSERIVEVGEQTKDLTASGEVTRALSKAGGSSYTWMKDKIPYYKQDCSQWCWAACLAMMHQWWSPVSLGSSEHQQEEIAQYVHGPDTCEGATVSEVADVLRNWDQIDHDKHDGDGVAYEDWLTVYSGTKGKEFDKDDNPTGYTDDPKTWIAYVNSPVYLAVDTTGNQISNHAILCVGYDDDDNDGVAFINNPTTWLSPLCGPHDHNYEAAFAYDCLNDHWNCLGWVREWAAGYPGDALAVDHADTSISLKTWPGTIYDDEEASVTIEMDISGDDTAYTAPYFGEWADSGIHVRTTSSDGITGNGVIEVDTKGDFGRWTGLRGRDGEVVCDSSTSSTGEAKIFEFYTNNNNEGDKLSISFKIDPTDVGSIDLYYRSWVYDWDDRVHYADDTLRITVLDDRGGNDTDFLMPKPFKRDNTDPADSLFGQNYLDIGLYKNTINVIDDDTEDPTYASLKSIPSSPVYDSHSGNIRLQGDVTDASGIYSIQFMIEYTDEPGMPCHYHDPSGHSGNTYWYDIPRDEWVQHIGATIEWQIKATDNDSDRENDRLTNWSGWQQVEIKGENQPPSLSSGLVAPESGNAAQTFQYAVVYRDTDGDAPTTKYVYIDGYSYTMTKISGDYISGAIFYYETTLPEGSHDYYFDFNDGHGHPVRLPDSGTYPGPSVSGENQPPSLSDPLVAPGSGNTSTRFNYYVIYKDTDGDIPTTKYVYVDGSSHTMTSIAGSPRSGAIFHYATTLPEGSHDYYFDFDDGHGHPVRLPPSGTYPGPSVGEDSPPSSSAGPIAPYWHKSIPFDVPFDATDDKGLSSITLYYQYSSDGSSWGGWTPDGSQSISGTSYSGNFSFNCPYGEGYYEFYTIATDDAAQSEAAPAAADASAGYDATPPPNPTPPATETHGVADDTWQTDVFDPAFTWSRPSDDRSGIDRYYVYWGPDESGTSDDYVTEEIYDPGPVEDGSTTYLRVQAEDNAKNPAANWVTLFIFKYGGPRTWYVDDDLADYPDADFTGIQDAVDAASPGDTIIVYPGTYIENVDVNKDNLAIQSESGAEATIVQAANPDDHVFEVTACSVDISGFTVIGATGEGAGFVVAGIYLAGNTDHCTVSDNIASDNYYGVHLYSSSKNIIVGNTALNNYSGIYLLSHSNNNTIYNNIINLNHKGGVVLDLSSINTLSGNTFTNDGLLAYASYQNTVTDNTVNGKPLVYVENGADSTVTNAGQVILVNSDNIVVKNLDLSNTAVGIQLYETNNCEIANNSINLNTYFGVLLWYSSNNTISSNAINSNDYGVFLFRSSNNTISDNTCSDNYASIILHSSINNILADNNVSNSTSCISLQSSSNNTITANTANSNGLGIYLLWSSGNAIYLNNFVDNSENVLSYDSANIWHSPEEITYTYSGNNYTNYLGNYWSDYAGSDADGDGVGDTPYSIDSDADNYPLVDYSENYEIGVSNFTLTVTSDGCCPINVQYDGFFDTVPAGGTQDFTGIPFITDVTLTANNSTEGCNFIEWTVDGDPVSGNPINVTMDSNHHAIAICYDGGVAVSIVPANYTAVVNETFTVDIELSGSDPALAAEAHIDFDNTYLEVQSITAGTALPNVFGSPPYFDNVAGTIDYSAGKLSGTLPTGTFTLATIELKALAETSSTTTLTFVFEEPTRVTDVITSPVASVLGTVTNGEITITSPTVNGQVAFQGRPDAPDASWVEPLTVVVYEQGASTVVDTYAVTTDSTGAFSFAFDHTLGTYDIGVKGSHTLSRLEEDVVIDSAITNVDFGILLEGDCYDNDVINTWDFGILADAFGSFANGPPWDERADLNNDGRVNIYDFGLLADNYSLSGEMPS